LWKNGIRDNPQNAIQKICAVSGQTFEIEDVDLAFYEKMKVPPPPSCVHKNANDDVRHGAAKTSGNCMGRAKKEGGRLMEVI